MHPALNDLLQEALDERQIELNICLSANEIRRAILRESYTMRLLPILANLNIGCRKAAAPNKGAAAFFRSTEFFVLR